MPLTQYNQEHLLAKYGPLWFNITSKLLKKSGRVMISSVLDSQICQPQADLFPSKTCDIGGLNTENTTAINSGRKMADLGLQFPWRDKDRPSTVEIWIRNSSSKKERTKNPICSGCRQSFVFSACISKHVFLCSNTIHNVISNYSLSRQTRMQKPCFPMRMGQVEVLWLSFCTGEPQTCLKECLSRA